MLEKTEVIERNPLVSFVYEMGELYTFKCQSFQN